MPELLGTSQGFEEVSLEPAPKFLLNTLVSVPTKWVVSYSSEDRTLTVKPLVEESD